MNLKLKLQFNTAMKKNVFFLFSNFIVLLFGFFSFLDYGKSVSGVFNILVFGTLQKSFFNNVYFPLICLAALLIIPKLSIYQLQNQTNPHIMTQYLVRRSLVMGLMLVISSLLAATIVSLFWTSKIKLNLFRELINLILYILLQAWFLIISFIIGLIKQITKKRLILIILIFALILINIWLRGYTDLKFAFVGITSFYKKVNYLDLIFQIVELPLSIIIVKELSKWILTIVDY